MMRTTRKALLLLALCSALAPAALRAQQGARDSVVYTLAPSSRLEVATGKAGLFGFAGHEHTIRARGFTGRVVHFPGAPARSYLEITIPTDSLEVLTPHDTAEIRKVTQSMREDVLHVRRFHEIRFVSRTVAPTASGFHIVADMTLHGQTHPVPADVRVRIAGDTLRAGSSFAIRQTSFGITPYRGGPGGTVQVADRVQFTIDVVAIRRR